MTMRSRSKKGGIMISLSILSLTYFLLTISMPLRKAIILSLYSTIHQKRSEQVTSVPIKLMSSTFGWKKIGAYTRERTKPSRKSHSIMRCLLSPMRTRDMARGVRLIRTCMRCFKYTIFLTKMQHLSKQRRDSINYF